MLKFSCSQCGQHISCGDDWSGLQIKCPACQCDLSVPQGQTPAASQPPASIRARITVAPTEEAPEPPPAAMPPAQRVGRRSKTGNKVVNKVVDWVVTAAVLGGIAWACITYIPRLVNEVKTAESKPSTNSQGAGLGGPMGEMNGAMDVSDAMDGSSAPRRSAAKPAVQPQAKPATNTAADKASGRGR